MKKGKILTINLILLINLLIFPFFSLANVNLPDPPNDYYLDELNMLDQSAKDNINSTNKELESKTGSQVVVATVKNTQSLPASDLAVKIFNKWKIGDSKKKNGVLILISQDDTSGKREVFIATGYGIEGRLNDGKVGRIIDNFMLSDLKASNYSKALNEGFNAVVAEIADEYQIKLDGNYDQYLKANNPSKKGISLGTLFLILICFIIFSNLIRRVLYRAYPSKRYINGFPRKRNYYSSSSSRSYESSFDSVFSGSDFGSSSFGGSSGGFSGGGGSSGGGGAGRGF